MKLIVGLGNPGEQYKKTRHNVGFMAVNFILNTGDEFLAARPGHEFKSKTFTVEKNGEKIVFLIPQTYMNDSGLALKVFCNFFKLDLAHDVLVIQDEADLPLGEIRLTQNSSSAGHKGIQSIINELGTQNFQRLRVGVETRASRNDMPTDAFVLQDFTDEELTKLQDEILPQVQAQVESFIPN